VAILQSCPHKNPSNLHSHKRKIQSMSRAWESKASLPISGCFFKYTKMWYAASRCLNQGLAWYWDSNEVSK
jgi:hypothetical protein